MQSAHESPHPYSGSQGTMTYPTAVRNAEEGSCVPCHARGEVETLRVGKTQVTVRNAEERSCVPRHARGEVETAPSWQRKPPRCIAGRCAPRGASLTLPLLARQLHQMTRFVDEE